MRGDGEVYDWISTYYKTALDGYYVAIGISGESNFSVMG